jgi:hypothetical protein
MITTPLIDLKENHAAFITKAAEEDVLITDKGRPIGVLHGFADDDDYEEYCLLNDPRFHAVVAESRQEYRDGRFTRLESIDED